MSAKEKVQVFIELLTDNDAFATEEEIKTYITNACKIITDSSKIEDVELFYDLKNVDLFLGLDAVEIIKDEHITPSMNLWGVLDGLDNWRDNKKQQEECVYMLWDLENHKCTRVNDTSLAEITERMILGSEIRYLLLNIEAIAIKRHFMPIFRDCRNMLNDKRFWRRIESEQIGGLPKFIYIDFVKDIDSLKKWMEENILKRIFKLNPKHGENGVGNWVEASLLLCNRREAQALLNAAIYDKKTRNYYNYDQTHKKYIIFEDENTSENTYHGYHLDSETDVPNTIRKKFEQIKQAHE